MARPTKHTPERKQRALDAVRAGLTRRAAAAVAGMCERTLYDWMGQSAVFAADIARADGEAEARMTALVVQAAQSGNVQAAMWWLERRRSEDYGRRERVDLDVYVRQRALELGLDPEQALMAIKPRIRLVS